MVISAKKETVVIFAILAGCLMLGVFYSSLFHSVDKDLAQPTVATPIVAPNEKNFFEDYRLDRDKIRSKQIELLREVVENPNSVTDIRKDAQHKLLSISDNMEKEIYVETVLAAKGFKDAVIFIHPENITVIISDEGMLPIDNEKLLDMVSQLINVSNEDIVVIEKH